MRLTYRWLKEYVDCHLPPQELTEKLTMAGIEVETVEELGEEYDGVVVGKIISIRPHAESDQLLVCMMDLGDERVPIVCGAPNLAQGDVVPVAKPGTVLPSGTKVETARIRGENSVGMLCSAEELILMDDIYGIFQLDKSLTPGMDLASAIGYNDTVLDINITPNRGDCLSLIGVAREVAAITGAELRHPQFEIKEEGRPAREVTSVQILDPELCTRYSARIIRGTEIKASPLWMQLRLKAAGMRPINNIVDITNYVMLEQGQPLHAFDFDLLAEDRIIVRRAKRGEGVVTLDGKSHTLDESMLVIADAVRGTALAGIMGGRNTEISEETQNIFLESAHFNQLNNRITAKKLGLSTEASYRYQRYVDPDNTVHAANRAAYFMSVLGGGKVAPGVVDEWPLKAETPKVKIRTSRTNKILGTTMSRDEISDYLRRLQIPVTETGQDDLTAAIPSYRSDLVREIDLVEEVARLYGYQNIKSTIPYGKISLKNPNVLDDPQRVVRDSIIEAGFIETINYSFLSQKSLDKLQLPLDDPRREMVELRNPLNQDWTGMRTTMLPGLLNTILFNFNRYQYNLKLFEIGKTFFPGPVDQLPKESDAITAAVTGQRNLSVWNEGNSEVDFYDLKGPLEMLLEKLRIEDTKFVKTDLPYLVPTRAAELIVRGESVGAIGELNAGALEAFHLNKKVVVFEIDLQKLLASRVSKPYSFQALPRFPSLLRDLALVVDEGVTAAEVTDSILEIAPDILKQVYLFDSYSGKQIAPGKRSLAYSLTFQAEDRTLMNQEIDRFIETLIAHLREALGATLR